MAKRIMEVKNLGLGCLVQVLVLPALAFGAVVWWPLREQNGHVWLILGAVVAVTCAIAGRSLNTAWRCGACGNPIAGQPARLCPTCHSELE